MDELLRLKGRDDSICRRWLDNVWMRWYYKNVMSCEQVFPKCTNGVGWGKGEKDEGKQAWLSRIPSNRGQRWPSIVKRTKWYRLWWLKQAGWTVPIEWDWTMTLVRLFVLRFCWTSRDMESWKWWASFSYWAYPNTGAGHGFFLASARRQELGWLKVRKPYPSTHLDLLVQLWFSGWPDSKPV